MNSNAFSNVFLSPPSQGQICWISPPLESSPLTSGADIFLCMLVHDGSFRKLGNCDFYRGVWYFAPIGGDTSFMGFTRDDASKAWLIIPLCASPLPAYTARSPGTAAQPFRGFPIYFPEIRPWPRCCACWQRSFSWN